MKVLFEEYAPIIITIIAVVALIAIIQLLLKADASGVVYQAFAAVMEKLKTLGTGVVTP